MQHTTIEDVLAWAAEVLRERRFARASPVYAGTGRVEVSELGIPVSQQDLDLLGWEDKVALAAKIWGQVERLPDGQGAVLALRMFGDYATAGRLRRAEVFQDAMRRQGVRVRLSYQYTNRQLGLLWKCEPKVAAARVREALEAAEEALRLCGDSLGYHFNAMLIKELN